VQEPEIQLAIGDLLLNTPPAWHVLHETENATPAASPRNELQTAAPLGAKLTA